VKDTAYSTANYLFDTTKSGLSSITSYFSSKSNEQACIKEDPKEQELEVNVSTEGSSKGNESAKSKINKDF
jgi:hypothetical protein